MQTLIAKPYHPDQNLRAMAFDNERRCLLTGSRRVLSWCAEKKKDIVGHGTGLMSVLYNSIVGLLVSSDDEGTVRVWNVEDGAGAPLGPATRMHAQAQSMRLPALAADARTRRRVHARAYKALLSTQWSIGTRETARFGRRWAQRGARRRRALGPLRALRFVAGVFRFLNAHGLSKLTAMSYDVDHRRLITAGQDDSIAIWNFSTGERLKTVRVPGDATAADAFVPFWSSEPNGAQSRCRCGLVVRRGSNVAVLRGRRRRVSAVVSRRVVALRILPPCGDTHSSEQYS